jgi:anti-sigma B factor antagonist
MLLTTRTIGNVTVLDVKGRLVLGDGDETFTKTVNELAFTGHVNIVLNMDAVTYIDSMGLGVLVSKYVTLRNRGGNLKVCNMHRRNFEVLTVTRLLTVFESFDSEDAAVASFATASSGL